MMKLIVTKITRVLQQQIMKKQIEDKDYTINYDKSMFDITKKRMTQIASKKNGHGFTKVAWTLQTKLRRGNDPCKGRKALRPSL